MGTIFMNSENSTTSESHVLILQLTDKLDLKRGEKNIFLSNLCIYFICSYNNNKVKIFVLTWKNKFELPDKSYSVSNIQDYFEYILKNHNKKVDNPSIRICANKIENSITFKIKAGYYRELLTVETMKLLGSTENKISKNNW